MVEWDHRYRPLAEGEIVQVTDEILGHDGWREVRVFGGPAPDPAYTSHRKYRRLVQPVALSG